MLLWWVKTRGKGIAGDNAASIPSTRNPTVIFTTIGALSILSKGENISCLSWNVSLIGIHKQEPTSEVHEWLFLWKNASDLSSQNGSLFCLWWLNCLWLNSPVRRIYHHFGQGADKKGCLISMSEPNSSHGCLLDKSQIHDAWTFSVKEAWPLVKYFVRLATPSDS